jgi:N-acetylneuraminate synthase
MNAPFIKVASMDVNNYPFLEYLAKKGRPIVISTGLSELFEIDRAIKTIEDAGNNQIVILHCVATYPPDDCDINLNNIKTLMTVYPEYPIGFSDHSLGTTIPLAAVSLGVCLIEKHFTLDKEMDGWDQKVSATQDEMKAIVDGSKRIVDAMGSFRVCASESVEKKREFRRSIVVSHDMKQGDVISDSDLDYKRPGGGFSPEAKEFVIGRILKNDVTSDHLLTKKDLV